MADPEASTGGGLLPIVVTDGNAPNEISRWRRFDLREEVFVVARFAVGVHLLPIRRARLERTLTTLFACSYRRGQLLHARGLRLRQRESTWVGPRGGFQNAKNPPPPPPPPKSATALYFHVSVIRGVGRISEMRGKIRKSAHAVKIYIPESEHVINTGNRM